MFLLDMNFLFLLGKQDKIANITNLKTKNIIYIPIIGAANIEVIIKAVNENLFFLAILSTFICKYNFFISLA